MSAVAEKTVDRIDLPVTGMTCAACAARIERSLAKAEGVEEASVNLATETAHVNYNPAMETVEDIINAVVKTGYGARELSDTGRAEEKARKLAAYQAELRMFWISAALSVPLLVQMGPMFWGGEMELLPRWLQLLLATPVQFWIGKRFYVGAWHALQFHVMCVGDDWRGTPMWDRMERDFGLVGVRLVYFPYTAHTSSTVLRRRVIES